MANPGVKDFAPDGGLNPSLPVLSQVLSDPIVEPTTSQNE